MSMQESSHGYPLARRPDDGLIRHPRRDRPERTLEEVRDMWIPTSAYLASSNPMALSKFSAVSLECGRPASWMKYAFRAYFCRACR